MRRGLDASRVEISCHVFFTKIVLSEQAVISVSPHAETITVASYGHRHGNNPHGPVNRFCSKPPPAVAGSAYGPEYVGRNDPAVIITGREGTVFTSFLASPRPLLLPVPENTKTFFILATYRSN